MDRIEDLLQRRPDLSTFLVHFTRDKPPSSAQQNLISMLHERTIEARSVYGLLKAPSALNETLAATQRCVCFSETPLEHAWMMCRPIEGRGHQFGNYAIAFAKPWARRIGANPIWYVDITPGHDWLMPPLNELAQLAIQGRAERVVNGQPVSVPIEQSAIAAIAPFIEQMGPTNEGYRKEFWWEREWRHVGSLYFNWDAVVAAFAPENEHLLIQTELRRLDRLRNRAELEPPKMLDPRWGLERMIARLAGLPDAEAGPFTS